jgi:hypothetical protein
MDKNKKPVVLASAEKTAHLCINNSRSVSEALQNTPTSDSFNFYYW